MIADQLPPTIMPDRWTNEHSPRSGKLIPNFRLYAASHAVKRAIISTP